MERRAMVLRLGAWAAVGLASVAAGFCPGCAWHCATDPAGAESGDAAACQGRPLATAYHHSDFHPVPVRPAFAPQWVGPPSGPEQIGAVATPRVAQPGPQLPSQQIQIAPPPPPDDSPRRLPTAKEPYQLFTAEAKPVDENSRSWIFATPEFARRQPAPVEARRSDEPPAKVTR